MKIDLQTLFNPRSVAVVGASNLPGKWGFMVPMSILSGGYSGKLFLVNPREKRVMGLRAFRSLSAIGEAVDLVVITIPASQVGSIIKECGDLGIRNAVVVSSNFSETGAEGQRLEEDLVQTARQAGVAIVGPNTMGLFSGPASLCALGAPVRPPMGTIAFVSQSGNLGIQLLSWGEQEGLGFSRFVGSGNEAILGCEDYLAYFGEDPATKLILMYIEGIDHGRRFIDVASQVTREKPIIALKVGKTAYGAKAAMSHSGSLAGATEICSAAFRQAGVIEAKTTAELIDLARAFARLPVPAGNRVGIMTMGGGWGVVTADACELSGLQIPDLPAAAITKLDEVLPQFWSRRNPVDLVGSVDRSAHFRALEVLVDCENVDAVLALGTLTGGMVSPEGFARRLAKFAWRLTKRGPAFLPLFIWSMFGGFFRSGRAKARSTSKTSGGSGGINLREASKWRDSVFAAQARELVNKSGKPIIAVTLASGRLKHLAREYNLAVYETPEAAAAALGRLAAYGQRKKLGRTQVSE